MSEDSGRISRKFLSPEDNGRVVGILLNNRSEEGEGS